MKPFVKWAGGKRQLLPHISARLPQSFNDYYEPFIGGGACLLEFRPENAIMGDINSVLINCYQVIRDNVESLMEQLDELSMAHSEAVDKKEFYYKMREEYNQQLKNEVYDIKTAALFIYLNKTCFNGLYRVNSKGLFNVPFNNKKTLNAYEKENLLQISRYLEDVTIKNSDFEETCKSVKKGDFVFFDSPYAPLKPDSFESYTKEGFSIEDHERLARLFKELTKRGAYCMLTNHNTELINELYKDYKIEVVQVKRFINSNANNRVGEEVIITNY